MFDCLTGHLLSLASLSFDTVSGVKREQTERGERTEANGVRVRLDLRTELGSFVIFRICRVVSEISQKKKKP